MNTIIDYLKSKPIHTPRIALARFLLAFALLLTVVFNDLDVIANHRYGVMPTYGIRHTAAKSIPFKQLDMFMVMDPSVARIVIIIILLMVMSGFFPKVTGILHFMACFSVHNYFMIINGGDEICLVMSLLLLPVCLTDNRLNQWVYRKETPSKWNITAGMALVVIQIQAAYIYFSAGYEKLYNRQWIDGTAAYYFTSHYRLGAPDWLRHVNELLTLTPAVRLLSWSVLALEFLLAACLFFPSRIRKKFLVPAIIFHLLIVFNFGLVSFFFSMLGMLTLFLDDEESFTGIFVKKKANLPQ